MSPRPSSATRKNEYKKGLNSENARRKREEKLVQIRKEKRSEGLKKRRNGLIHTAHLRYLEPKLEHLLPLVQTVLSDDSSQHLKATKLIRKLSSTGEICLIEEVVRAGIVPRLVEFLDEDAFPLLQTEAAWVLANIASGESDHVRLIIELGSIPKFVRLLHSSVVGIREQVVWALGNIAADLPDCRNHVLSGGALFPLLAQLKGNPELPLVRSTAWAISNLCNGKPPPPFEQVKPALPALRDLIDLKDEEVLIEACSALSSISDGSSHNIQSVIEAGVCPRLLELLVHPSPKVQELTLQTLGNIMSGDDAQTEELLNYNPGLLPLLYQFLTGNCERVKKEACWVISNITGGNEDLIQGVIDAKIIPPVVRLLQHARFEIKKEAAWAISNAVMGGSDQQIQYLVNQGCIKPLCDLLICSDPKIVGVCLDGVECILESGETIRELGTYGVMGKVEECEGLDKIERLQSHENEEVNKKASEILDKYWNK